MMIVTIGGSADRQVELASRVCSRGFWRITGDIRDRREPPTGRDQTGPRFVVQAAIGVKADSARTCYFGSEGPGADNLAYSIPAYRDLMPYQEPMI